MYMLVFSSHSTFKGESYPKSQKYFPRHRICSWPFSTLIPVKSLDFTHHLSITCPVDNCAWSAGQKCQLLSCTLTVSDFEAIVSTLGVEKTSDSCLLPWEPNKKKKNLLRKSEAFGLAVCMKGAGVASLPQSEQTSLSFVVFLRHLETGILNLSVLEACSRSPIPYLWERESRESDSLQTRMVRQLGRGGDVGGGNSVVWHLKH